MKPSTLKNEPSNGAEYRIFKMEHVKTRSGWLTQILLNVKPVCYRKVASIEDARENLRCILGCVKNAHLINPDTQIQEKTDSLVITNKFNNPVVDFLIIRC